MVLFLIACGGFTEWNDDVVIGPMVELDREGEVLFEWTPYGSTSWTDIELRSTGDSPVFVVELSLDGIQADHFTLPDELPVPLRLAPQESFPFQVGFQPAAIGQFTADLWIVTGDDTPDLTLRLVGNGCEDWDDDGACDE
jgi:hypothetical protein